ncbi:GNAT family N-acetyltransferase [Mangrovibacillus cuniculi]|uniref:GNAT family N-acetyltransferase n=1 Tax=Mangrovibacillus cuniculi TaxID=2593652 RepID=A0A7S8C8Y5_9BACI|nr:GNAT family N-acetyltransferase [Mangrovibacillus cuniculi]QPC45586.1 GNAT family N-acetyltransferase [Mangrovibacillus cuniculi]
MIHLIKMNENQYNKFFEETVKEYAEENVKEGRWTSSEAMDRARKETHELLPEGIQTEGHYICSIQHAVKGQVGTLWYAIKEKKGEKVAFIYSIQLKEAFQGMGYGKQALTVLEAGLVSQSVSSIGLHVFGHNERAFQLYRKMGYLATSIKMKKQLKV